MFNEAFNAVQKCGFKQCISKQRLDNLDNLNNPDLTDGLVRRKHRHYLIKNVHNLGSGVSNNEDPLHNYCFDFFKQSTWV